MRTRIIKESGFFVPQRRVWSMWRNFSHSNGRCSVGYRNLDDAIDYIKAKEREIQSSSECKLYYENTI